MKRNVKVVVSGFLGLLPAGGLSWDYVQYPVGFRELGCDVLYLEDTQTWPIFQDTSGGINCDLNVNHVAYVMRHFDMSDCWAYRDAVTDQFFGLSQDAVKRFCASADIFLNISCSTPLREEYAAIPVRALLDTDPMFTQVQNATGNNLYGGKSAIPQMVAGHTHLFTYGENVTGPDCQVPWGGRAWLATRQPAVLKYWPVTPVPDGPYTSLFNWSAAKEFEFNGRQWGQKNLEFVRFLDLPRRLPGVSFRISVGQTASARAPFPASAAKEQGWEVLGAEEIGFDIELYQSFIRKSRAEFSVAKHTYVQANTGWFSGRSACYLASGRPVITQDTGWSKMIRNGCGLYSFSDAESALAAIRQVEAEPKKNGLAAREIAEEYFESNIVLGKMIEDMGL